MNPIVIIVIVIVVVAIVVFGYMSLRCSAEYNRILRHIREVMDEEQWG